MSKILDGANQFLFGGGGEVDLSHAVPGANFFFGEGAEMTLLGGHPPHATPCLLITKPDSCKMKFQNKK